MIRNIEIEDAEAFWNLQSELDSETTFMMYEPGERKKDLDRLKALIHSVKENSDLLLVVEHECELIGFLLAQRGFNRKTAHRAYIVTGIRKAFQRQKIGTRLFKELDGWAIQNQIRRLDLTVMTPNLPAKNLYEKQGFIVEGVKKDSMYVNGEYLDEYYMAKIFSR